MAVDEVPDQPVRLRLRRKLEELVGVDEADLLLDRPPGGWGSLVTRDWLDERLTHEREVTDQRFQGIDERFRSLEALLDERFRSLEARFGERFGSLEARFGERFGSLEAHFDERFGSLEDRFDERFRGIDQRFLGIDHQFASLEHKLIARIDRAATAQTKWLVGLVVGATAVVVAALKV